MAMALAYPKVGPENRIDFKLVHEELVDQIVPGITRHQVGALSAKAHQRAAAWAGYGHVPDRAHAPLGAGRGQAIFGALDAAVPFDRSVAGEA
jgi:hypothetical protein